MLGLTTEFRQCIINTHGAAGGNWLEQLPKIIAYAASRWQLTNLQTMPVLTYNYVASSLNNVNT